MLKDDLLRIKACALKAVDPAPAIQKHLYCDAGQIRVGHQTWDLRQLSRMFVIAVGKAAIPMAESAADILGPHLTSGLVVTKYAHGEDHRLPESFQVFESGHPVPDEAGLTAAKKVVELVETTTERDLVVLLISGGGSALLPLPARNLSLVDLQETTQLLLRSGATIGELNAVRKHLSSLKGGQLARLAMPASVVALILSDVVGDRLDVIASGLTVPDSTEFTDAVDVVKRYMLWDAIPEAVRMHLERGCSGDIRETPKPGDAIFEHVSNVIVGSNRMAALAAVAQAEELGYHTLLCSTFLEGEAREAAKVFAAMAKGARLHHDPVPPPLCFVFGGETTVTVRGQGKGGRNQELALAAALALDQLPDVALMALATDGTDGPTDAAGAIVDGETVELAKSLGVDLVAALADNDAYPVLASIGALLHTGPTGTNVNDIIVLLIA